MKKRADIGIRPLFYHQILLIINKRQRNIQFTVCLYLQQKYKKLSKCLVVFTRCNLFAVKTFLNYAI